MFPDALNCTALSGFHPLVLFFGSHAVEYQSVPIDTNLYFLPFVRPPLYVFTLLYLTLTLERCETKLIDLPLLIIVNSEGRVCFSPWGLPKWLKKEHFVLVVGWKVLRGLQVTRLSLFLVGSLYSPQCFLIVRAWFLWTLSCRNRQLYEKCLPLGIFVLVFHVQEHTILSLVFLLFGILHWSPAVET